jgi:hypothetical protein
MYPGHNKLRQIIREMLEQTTGSYSFLPAGVSIDDYARVIRAMSVYWTSAVFGEKPLPRDSILRALDAVEDPIDKETIQFILEMYDKTISSMDKEGVLGLMYNMEMSLGLDLFDSKDGDLKELLIGVSRFSKEGHYVVMTYYARHSILALDPKGPGYRYVEVGKRYLKLFRDAVSSISPEFFDTMHKLIDANEFFLVPHKLDPEYVERVYDNAATGLEGLEQSIELIKTLEMSD